MTYGVEYVYVDRYEWIRGEMYKRLVDRDRVRVCVMTAKLSDAADLADLIYFADRLKAVIRWDSDKQVAQLRLTLAPGQLAVTP